MKKKIQDALKAGLDIYIAVVYCKDGSIHLLPEPDRDSAYRVLLKMRGDAQCFDRISATTIAKRSATGFADGKIFGSPKSLDVMQLTDKQFNNIWEKYFPDEAGTGDDDDDNDDAASPEDY